MFPPKIRTRVYVFLIAIPLSLALPLGAAHAQADALTANSPQAATITLNVPLDALIWIDGQRVHSTGLTRRFVTPPLKPGHKYGYDLRVSWVEGSRAKRIDRHLTFGAGDNVRLSFTSPTWMQPAMDVYMDPAAPNPWRVDHELDPLNQANYPNLQLYNGYRLYPR